MINKPVTYSRRSIPPGPPTAVNTRRLSASIVAAQQGSALSNENACDKNPSVDLDLHSEDLSVKSAQIASKLNRSFSPSLSPNLSLVPKNGGESSPDLLSGVQEVRQDNQDSDFRPENGEEEIFCDYDTEPSPELERPDSILGNRKKGFLKKLSIAKWTGKKKMSKLEPDYFRDGDTTPIRSMDLLLRKSMDDLGSRDEPGVTGQTSTRPGTQGSVTRIEVGLGRAGFQGLGSGVCPGDELDTHLTKSLSPGSRKSLYSGYIRPHFNMAKSDDSGIIATSRPDSSTSNLPPARKSFSGSSDHSSRASPSEPEAGEGRTSDDTTSAKDRTSEDELRNEGRSMSRISEVGNHTTIVISTTTSNCNSSVRGGGEESTETNNNVPRKPSNAR